MKKLNLTRPLVFFDLETTGTSVTKDKIVQIAAIKVHPDGTEEVKKTLVNPQMPIPKEATEVHGITDAMVKKAPTFLQISKSMLAWLVGCDLAGYNSDVFDIPLLSEEFNRVILKFPMENTVYVDMLKIERLVNSHKLEATYKRYTGKDLEGAHDAEADTRATMDVLMHQITNFDLPLEVDKLQAYGLDGKERVDLAGKLCKNENGEICYNFGKSKGVPVKKDAGFGRWMLNSDFSTETKEMVRELIG